MFSLVTKSIIPSRPGIKVVVFEFL